MSETFVKFMARDLRVKISSKSLGLDGKFDKRFESVATSETIEIFTFSTSHRLLHPWKVRRKEEDTL